jgi:aminopeptidase N
MVSPCQATSKRSARRHYLAQNRFGVAEPATLRAAFQTATPIDLTPFWERWRDTAG